MQNTIELKSETIRVRMTPQAKRDLTQAAERRQRNWSDYVRIAVEAAVRKDLR